MEEVYLLEVGEILLKQHSMGVYEKSIVPVKISRLAEFVSQKKRISLDDWRIRSKMTPLFRS